MNYTNEVIKMFKTYLHLDENSLHAISGLSCLFSCCHAVKVFLYTLSRVVQTANIEIKPCLK